MKYVRIALAVLLLPVVAALCWSFFETAVGLGKSVSAAAVPFWLGLGSYFIFQQVFARPMRTYVFGHELTHALVGMMSGARLKSFKVTASGGSVVLTKTSVWIALAPYFIPIYTVLLVLLYWLAGQFWDVQAVHPYYLFAAGFTLAFHFGLTHYALLQGQSDLQQYGVFFSSVLILIINCLVMIVLLKLLFPAHVAFKGYFTASAGRTGLICQNIYLQGRHLWNCFR